MVRMYRRHFIWGGAATTLLPQLCTMGCDSSAPPQGQQGQKGMPLDLNDYQPKSMLHVEETRVTKPRFPVIDFHAHLSFQVSEKSGVPVGEEMSYIWPPEKLLPVMERKGIRTLVNLTGGIGKGLQETVRRYDKAHPGRFITFVEPLYGESNRPEYPKLQADAIERAHKSGARGLKVLKVLGLYLRENITTGALVKVDDKRFDPMWEACAAFDMPVAIHVSDPEAFFLPIDRFNERFEELNNHPDWSFYGKDFPSHAELMEARNRMFSRHPKTNYVALHFGNNSENLGAVGEWMDRFPNMYVDLAARIGELGRQPRTARKFFDKYQDRILFGTDAIPDGWDYPQQVFTDELYEIYYRFLETENEYFDYAPAAVPPQGRWRIYGLGLPEGILRKVYYENTARLLKVQI